MGSILKRQKLSEEQYGDRISNLSNSLIAQILSRLPTKYAVSTSVLSKRWRELWTSITSFDIDDRLFLCPQNKSSDPSMQRSFTSFMNRVLLHHASCVEKFRLKCSESYDTSLVNGWIAYALRKNVRELDLYLSYHIEQLIMLPQDLFTCRTLAVLQLKSGHLFMKTAITPVSLPSLKILRLDGIAFIDDDSINRFLFGCPLLEELSMRSCLVVNGSVMNIVAPRLTSLLVCECLFIDGRPPHGFECMIVLHTPALLYLTIYDFHDYGCYSVVGNLLHLIRANILLRDNGYSAKALNDLIKAISNAQFLQLDITAKVDDSYMCHVQVPKFPNMTSLELGQYPSGKFLVELLENSPHLETLVFKEDIGDCCEMYIKLLQSPARNVPSCLLFHLKVIEFRDFGGLTEEWEMVDYFLNNTKVLEKVNIDYGYGGLKWTIHPSRT